MNAGGYKVAIVLKDEGGLLSKLENLQKTGVRAPGGIYRRAAELSGSTTPVVKPSELRNALKGAVDAGPGGRKKVLPSSTGIEARPEATGATPIGVNFGTQQPPGGEGLFSKLSELMKKFSSQEGIFSQIQALQSSSLLKLGGIALGVGSLVTLAVKSSAILQGTLKLMETSVMLIFKPMGDAIGLVLRPFALMMLSAAIPYYREVGAWWKQNGTALAKFLTDPTKNPAEGIKAGINIMNFPNQIIRDLMDGLVSGPLQGFIDHVNKRTEEINQGIANFATTIGMLGADLWTKLQPVGSMIFGYLASIGRSIWQTLSTIPSILYGYLSSIGTSIWTTLSAIPAYFYSVLGSIGTMMSDTLASIPTQFLDVFTGLAAGLKDALANVPQLIRQAIIALANSIFPSGGGSVDNSTRFTRQRSSTLSRTEMQAVADTLE